MNVPLPKALFEVSLSDPVETDKTITKDAAEALFRFFRECALFRWSGSNNDCEDRADALCILLDAWKIPNYKGWVFSGDYLKKGPGRLVNFWNYHVAAVLPVQEWGAINFYVIDPATSNNLEPIQTWADKVTDAACSYYMIKQSACYIFNQQRVETENWYKRDKQNYKWTVQGLSGINGVTKTGKAQLCFNKSKIKRTENTLKRLIRTKPAFLEPKLPIGSIT